jgi:hypothetical protein
MLQLLARVNLLLFSRLIIEIKSIHAANVGKPSANNQPLIATGEFTQERDPMNVMNVGRLLAMAHPLLDIR